MLPVSVVQQSSIFGPADFGRRKALCRTEYGQWSGGVSEEGTMSNADVDVLLKNQGQSLLLSDDHWFGRNCHQRKELWPVRQSVCGTNQIQTQHKEQICVIPRIEIENYTGVYQYHAQILCFTKSYPIKYILLSFSFFINQDNSVCYCCNWNNLLFIKTDNGLFSSLFVLMEIRNFTC